MRPEPPAPSGSIDGPLFGDRPIDERLELLLRGTFRLASFRPYQRMVCHAVVAGQDALLVMPTGAGKSLCYQLPGLARGGTTLVISPLIALMEDQVAKLRLLQLRAEAIHSGRTLEESRRACRAYLDGRLDFLFVAPERLAVSGFPEMLAKRKPVLVAVDEAHCISHWGHDFRPEYRLLGQRLPLLRPAPVIATTATATPQVQQDICAQLGLADTARFIHGFRRTNIGVEAVDLPPSARREAVERLLSQPERRPAIVYARTRKEADELAAQLGRELPAASYHAGMAGAARDLVQAQFLSGELEVIVATIAFGMGVDKPNIRTVIHTGLPGSVESYYQEIGRAGRDGAPSRAMLLFSWADRRTHEFFHRRDYPEPEVLESIQRELGATARTPESVRDRLQLEAEAFEKALEKLWLHGGARLDSEGGVSRGSDGWRAPYHAQREHKLGQLDAITRFAESHDCRMLHLVRHFGDAEDSGAPCGLCDVCSPASAEARQEREPHAHERRLAERLLSGLRQRDGVSTGQLYRQLVSDEGELERKLFDRLLGGLSRAGLVQLAQDSFTKDGELIRFERVYLTPDGVRGSAQSLDGLRLPADVATRAKSRKLKAVRTRSEPEADGDPEATATLFEALRAWRLAEAKRARVPAFHVLHDRTLLAIATARPRDEDALLAVPGMGPARLKKHGIEILRIVAQTE